VTTEPDNAVILGAGLAGFAEAHHVCGVELAERSCRDRVDGLHPSSGEDLVLATT
jgi:hypothetical protein